MYPAVSCDSSKVAKRRVKSFLKKSNELYILLAFLRISKPENKATSGVGFLKVASVLGFTLVYKASHQIKTHGIVSRAAKESRTRDC